tara:strand:- start:256 stop:567 length:312 start_codon:yes stop_codon:yes gene_type:complete
MFKPVYPGQSLVAELGYQELVTITTALRVYAEGQNKSADDIRKSHDAIAALREEERPQNDFISFPDGYLVTERVLRESAKRAQDLWDLLTDAHPDKAYFTTED